MLVEGVDTGIGTAGSVDGDLLLTEDGQHPLDLTLDRPSFRLTLPSGKVRSVILNCQKYVLHLTRPFA